MKLTGLAFHLTVDDPAIIDILADGDPLALGRRTTREGPNPSDPVVLNGDPAPNGEMCVFFEADETFVLEVGESQELELRYRAKKKGSTTLSCHVHATVDPDSLFANQHGSKNEAHTIKVKA